MHMGLKKGIVIVNILIMLTLVGCSSNIAVLMAGHSNGKEIEYSYHYFDGIKRTMFHMEKGTKVKLTYQVEIEKGEIVISIYKKDGTIAFNKGFTENDEGEEIITIDEEGKYYIQAQGKKTKGSFLLQYDEVK